MRTDREVCTMADFMRFPTAREQVLTNGDTKIGIIPEICLVSLFQVGSWQVLYRHDPTWKWETRQISGMMPIVVSPLVSTCSRAVGNRIKSAIVHTSLSVLIELSCRYCISQKVYVQNGLSKNTTYCVLLPGRFILYCVTMRLDIPGKSMYE